MPKIRSLKRSYFRSHTVKKMSRPARLTLAGVIAAMADDEGRFVADARLVRTEVYPWDDDVTDAEVEAHLREAAQKKVRLVRLYSVRGVRYAYFPRWDQHQWISKKTPSSIPAMPARYRHDAQIGTEHTVTVSARHARALDEGEGIREKGQDEGRDDLFRKGALSKKLPSTSPNGDSPLSGKGHAAAVALLETKGLLKRQDPAERTLAQEEAARATRAARARRG